MERAREGPIEIASGCFVTYELETIDILRSLIRVTTDRQKALKRYYEEFVEPHGARPRALEAFHEGFNPRAARAAHVRGRGWEDARSWEQERRFARFVDTAPRGTCVIDCGAGKAIPTVRYTSERAAARLGGTMVRINVREPEAPPGHVGLPIGALAALTRIEALLAS